MLKSQNISFRQVFLTVFHRKLKRRHGSLFVIISITPVRFISLKKCHSTPNSCQKKLKKVREQLRGQLLHSRVLQHTQQLGADPSAPQSHLLVLPELRVLQQQQQRPAGRPLPPAQVDRPQPGGPSGRRPRLLHVPHDPPLSDAAAGRAAHALVLRAHDLRQLRPHPCHHHIQVRYSSWNFIIVIETRKSRDLQSDNDYEEKLQTILVHPSKLVTLSSIIIIVVVVL